MSNLTIVNKFCAYNNFMPTELYTEKGWVVVKYSKKERKEYNAFITAIGNTNIFKSNKIKAICDPMVERVYFAPRGK